MYTYIYLLYTYKVGRLSRSLFRWSDINGTHFSWPKINGFPWGYFTLVSGVRTPFTTNRGPALWLNGAGVFYLHTQTTQMIPNAKKTIQTLRVWEQRHSEFYKGVVVFSGTSTSATSCNVSPDLKAYLHPLGRLLATSWNCWEKPMALLTLGKTYPPQIPSLRYPPPRIRL